MKTRITEIYIASEDKNILQYWIICIFIINRLNNIDLLRRDYLGV